MLTIIIKKQNKTKNKTKQKSMDVKMLTLCPWWITQGFSLVRLASSLETNFYVARFLYIYTFFSCFDTQTRSNLYCLGKVKNQIICVLNCLTFRFFKDWYGHNAKLNFLQEKYQPCKKDISCVKLAYETSAAKAAKKSKA